MEPKVILYIFGYTFKFILPNNTHKYYVVGMYFYQKKCWNVFLLKHLVEYIFIKKLWRLAF